MRRRVQLSTVLTLVIAFVAAQALAQTPVQSAAGQAVRLRVFLDCSDCFQEFLRDEIDWVDFVRQAQDADIHLLSSSNSTGGGGREVVLRFVGVGRLEGVSHEHRALSLPNEPENLRRQTILRTVTIGLLDSLAHLGPPGVEVTVEALRGAAAAGAVPSRDPWNLWFFRVSASASINAEESNREVSWDGNVSADRVTEAWKMSFGVSVDEETQTFDLDEDDPFEVTRREREVDWFVAKSLGPHWSIGLDGRIETSTFGNTRFSGATAPAVEFSVFPYTEYASRQFLVQYDMGPEYARYNEITLFGKTRETLWRHELAATFDQRQPWGSLDLRAEWSQYLHDASKYRVEVDGEVSVRITRGLSVDLEGSASRIRDQLSLPRRSATPEEVLLRLRELQSGYDVSFSVGLSYSFGSIFNNVVNPRFPGR